MEFIPILHRDASVVIFQIPILRVYQRPAQLQASVIGASESRFPGIPQNRRQKSVRSRFTEYLTAVPDG